MSKTTNDKPIKKERHKTLEEMASHLDAETSRELCSLMKKALPSESATLLKFINDMKKKMEHQQKKIKYLTNFNKQLIRIHFQDTPRTFPAPTNERDERASS